MNTTDNRFSAEELKKIDQADDLKISPLRSDGVTFGTPTWIWAVVVDGDLYVRAYNGKNSSWYQSAVQRKAGRIHAAGMVEDVIFENVPSDLDNAIDEAYKAKYSSSPYLPPMISEGPKRATIRIRRE
ncbi:DUF2255 family protein [Dyadobacter sp. 676]|uniref:DUF2255 family protein n=1 Tax=Dyadobacter sp. 676 TaxID=3088362 RepID=A0AAU8FIZ9_9BACT